MRIAFTTSTLLVIGKAIGLFALIATGQALAGEQSEWRYQTIDTPRLISNENEKERSNLIEVTPGELSELTSASLNLQQETHADWEFLYASLAKHTDELKLTTFRGQSDMPAPLKLNGKGAQFSVRLQGDWPTTGQLIWEKTATNQSDEKVRVEFNLKEKHPDQIFLSFSNRPGGTTIQFSGNRIQKIFSIKNRHAVQVMYDTRGNLTSLSAYKFADDNYLKNLKF